MSILRNLERQLMHRAAAKSPEVSLTRLMSVARHEVEDKEEAKVIVKLAMDEVEAMKAKMVEVEKKERDLTFRLYKVEAMEKQAAEDKKKMAGMHGDRGVMEQKLNECNAMHQKIHSAHESTIHKQQLFIDGQQATIAEMQKKLDALGKELHDECKKPAKIEYVTKPGAPEKRAKPPPPPTVEFEVVRSGDGRIAKIVAKPK